MMTKNDFDVRLIDNYDFDLVLWGHEHLPFKILEDFENFKFKIY